MAVPRGGGVRPATDALRQAVFSSLGARVAGARFLDLFAGSGAYGLEALSRGAAGGIFVESNARAAACLRRNLAAVCRSLGRSEEDLAVRQGDARHPPPDAIAGADLVFIDPPYELLAAAAPPLFACLAEAPSARPDALVVCEMPGEVALDPPGWKVLRRLGGRGPRRPTAAIYGRA